MVAEENRGKCHGSINGTQHSEESLGVKNVSVQTQNKVTGKSLL